MKTNQWAILIVILMLAMPDMPALWRRTMVFAYAVIYFAILFGWIK